MAERHAALVYLVPWFVLIGIALSMFIQGWMIMHEQFGYRENPKLSLRNNHPEMRDYVRGSGLLVVNFYENLNPDYDGLRERIAEIQEKDQDQQTDY